ncbi:MAG: hypothetical protein M3R31_02200 [Pseudomonadota bacterium]|nr:hypothetical protein [Pseudomonadota bacterium]
MNSRHLLRHFAALASALVASAANGSFHTFAIESIYSNADGTVQYVVLRESSGTPGKNVWGGQTFTSTHAGVTKTFMFPSNLPSSQTSNKRVLIATQGFASLGFIVPDYVIPNQFLATAGGTLNYAGVDPVTYASLPTDGVNAITRTGTSTPNVATNFAGATAVIPPLPDVSVEYYNATLDHYFISDLQPDIDALDTGHFPGWTRTAKSFKVFASQASGGPGVNPVCRFYIPPAHGNSHFFSASPAECALLQQKMLTDPNYSGYVYETPNAFYIALPDTATGACPSATIPVYRLWNQRADSNHRYTTDPAIKAQMIVQGYVAEGYGPDAVIMCAPTPGTATVRFLSVSSPPNGTLVSDGSSTATANYQGYATPVDNVNVGARSGTGEAVAFSEHRPVAVQSVVWATGGGNQTVNVPFANEFDTPVTIWVVAGPYATMQQTALTLWQTAQQIYWDERLGVHLSLEVVDATANPKAATWSAFTCGAGNANVTAIQSDIGVRAGRMNVYLVNLVDGSTSRGNACGVGGGFVAIAAGSGAELLAHELGHDFGLEHIDDLIATFDTTNVMHSASAVRQFFTEGQTFRAHLRPNSAINAVYGLRPGLRTRACDRDTMLLGCPSIAKRIWADGSSPPN